MRLRLPTLWIGVQLRLPGILSSAVAMRNCFLKASGLVPIKALLGCAARFLGGLSGNMEAILRDGSLLHGQIGP